MNQSKIIRECTEEFETKLRTAVETAEREGALGVEVEINIRTMDESEEECSRWKESLSDSRKETLERLAWTMDMLATPEHLHGVEDLGREYVIEKGCAGNFRNRLEAALLEYMERIAAGNLEPHETMPDIVAAAELLDKLLLRREAKQKE